MNKIVKSSVRRSRSNSEWFAASKNRTVTIVTIPVTNPEFDPSEEEDKEIQKKLK